MKNYIELCKAENVKGAIFFGLMNNDPQIEELKNYKQIPFVYLIIIILIVLP